MEYEEQNKDLRVKGVFLINSENDIPIEDRFELKLSRNAKEYVNKRDYVILTTELLYLIYLNIENDESDSELPKKLLELLKSKTGLITSRDLDLLAYFQT
ncbi:MAG: hypothetical protein HeimC3_39360 [Candidatus Heimdallarchaeota archaeon LC_3]|nr:MAG: hypothetical protein HeimC3_39360 [Candidatus Heimdallarchaeota archaeon LC_3]